jgi:hypothetical protein
MSNIAIIKQPAQLNLTGNPMVLRIAGKNAFSGILTKAVAGLIISGSGTYYADNTITFTWGGKTVTYTVKENAAENKLEIPTTLVIATGTDLMPYFLKSADLTGDYVITCDANTITFTAKKAGSDYNLVISGMMVNTPGQPNRMVWPDQNPINSTSSLNAGYKIGINIEKSDETIKMEFPVDYLSNDDITAGFDPNSSGVVEEDISEILKAESFGNFTFPDPNVFSRIHDIIKQFKVFLYEKPGNVGIYSETYKYLQGKLPDFVQGELNYQGKSVYDLIRENKMFLTFAPLQKTIDIYSPEKLYFLFIQAGTYSLVSKEYFYDGTTLITTRESFTATDFEIREFFVSYAKIHTNYDKLLKYEIYLLDQEGSSVSEIRTFAIDYRYQNYARYFIFANDFGVYEVLRTIGKATKTLQVDKSFVNIPLPSNFTELSWGQKQISESDLATYKVNSGYLPDKYWADWMKTFLRSPEVYWLKKGHAYPVIILPSKNPTAIDGDYNPFQEFELVHSIQDDFTEEFDAHYPILSGDFDIDFDVDFDNGDDLTYDGLFASDFSSWTDGIPDGFYFTPHSAYIENSNDQVKISCSKDVQQSGGPFGTIDKLLEFGKKYRVEFDVIDVSIVYDTIPSIYCNCSMGGSNHQVISEAAMEKIDVVKHWIMEGTINLEGGSDFTFNILNELGTSLAENPFIIIDNLQINEIQ